MQGWIKGEVGGGRGERRPESDTMHLPAWTSVIGPSRRVSSSSFTCFTQLRSGSEMWCVVAAPHCSCRTSNRMTLPSASASAVGAISTFAGGGVDAGHVGAPPTEKEEEVEKGEGFGAGGKGMLGCSI